MKRNKLRRSWFCLMCLSLTKNTLFCFFLFVCMFVGARAGRFYLLRKLHKKGCLGRPVISGCNTPTEKISAFVDRHLKPLIAVVPSYVKDTNDFLKYLRDISTLPSCVIMVTIDVVGLYLHIPHDEGLQSREALNNRENPEIPTETIVDLAELVLTSGYDTSMTFSWCGRGSSLSWWSF